MVRRHDLCFHIFTSDEIDHPGGTAVITRLLVTPWATEPWDIKPPGLTDTVLTVMQRAGLALPPAGRMSGVGSFYLSIVLCTFIWGKQRIVRLFLSCHLLSSLNLEKHSLACITKKFKGHWLQV